MRTEKRKYIPPLITISFIELEHSIAASSSTLNPGNVGNTSSDHPLISTEDVSYDDHYWDFD